MAGRGRRTLVDKLQLYRSETGCDVQTSLRLKADRLQRKLIAGTNKYIDANATNDGRLCRSAAIADPPIAGQIYPSWWTPFRGLLQL